MEKITIDEIRSFIYKVTNEQVEYGDIRFLDNIKSNIFTNFGSNEYIKEFVTDNIDMNIINLKKYCTYKITENQTNRIIHLIKEISRGKEKDKGSLKVKKLPIHFLSDYLYKAIKDINTITGDKDEIVKVNATKAIFERTIRNLYLIKLIENDEKQNISRLRDKHKIENAIDILLEHSDDENLKYHLSKIYINKNSDITKAKILKCIFCGYTEYLINQYQISNNKAKEIAKYIMFTVFDDNTSYNIYPKTNEIKFKSFYLKEYISK